MTLLQGGSKARQDDFEGTSDVIVRVLHEGQYELEDAAKARLDELDEDVFKAVLAGNADRYHELFVQVLQVIRDQGKPLAADDLRPSDLILPAPDSTMAEVKSLLEQEGLISAP